MKKDKIYRGKIKGIKLIASTTFGQRTYQVTFKSGCAYFKLPKGYSFKYKPGDIINFNAIFKNRIWQAVISDKQHIYTEKEKEIMYHQEQQSKMIMSYLENIV